MYSLGSLASFIGFLACLAGSALCFLFSFIFVSPPILLVRPHKFALAFTLGSVLFMAGYVRPHTNAQLCRADRPHGALQAPDQPGTHQVLCCVGILSH